MRTAATSAGGAQSQPTFHPVNEKVLPDEEIVTVRSRMPGSVASGMCSRPSKTRCSYTSSVMARRSCSIAQRGDVLELGAMNTLPVGLCGVLSRIARVRGVIAARELVRVERPVAACGRSVTTRRRAPASATRGRVGVVVGLEHDDLVARVAQREHGRAIASVARR